MPAARFDITIEEGSRTRVRWRWLQADGVTPYDLSSYSALLQVREDKQSNTVLLQAATADLTGADGAGWLTLDDEGYILLDIPANETFPASLAELKKALYDLKLYPTGFDETPEDETDTIRLVEGKVIVSHQVTDRS